ncbi:hypothetical protein GCM10010331_27790 [Streptomyces xanthochromogenes]|uniref:DUF2470 domain-containing protein n=1 Tax=Streptomyces TaxID=1883 RepID=UPI001421089B|nr:MULTISPECIES: DUF2470 domain-containing protein [Streptomyces]GHB38619.1 hypothetical protein GCM10010331_27790 [Streptomyces xanthochromogenes]
MRPFRVRSTTPTAAERVRSILAAAHSMTVVTDEGRHEVYCAGEGGAAGRIHLHEPGDLGHARRTGPLSTRLELTDIAPTPVRDRMRARVTLAGLLSAPYDPGSTESTCMEFAGAWIEDAQGRTDISLDALQETELDPLATREAGMLNHLVDSHKDLVPLLLRLVRPQVKSSLSRVLPVALDRYGLTLRLEYPATHQDVRLPFPRPVKDIEHAGPQIHALLSAARRSSHSSRLPA